MAALRHAMARRECEIYKDFNILRHIEHIGSKEWGNCIVIAESADEVRYAATFDIVVEEHICLPLY